MNNTIVPITGNEALSFDEERPIPLLWIVVGCILAGVVCFDVLLCFVYRRRLRAWRPWKHTAGAGGGDNAVMDVEPHSILTPVVERIDDSARPIYLRNSRYLRNYPTALGTCRVASQATPLSNDSRQGTRALPRLSEEKAAESDEELEVSSDSVSDAEVNEPPLVAATATVTPPRPPPSPRGIGYGADPEVYFARPRETPEAKSNIKIPRTTIDTASARVGTSAVDPSILSNNGLAEEEPQSAALFAIKAASAHAAHGRGSAPSSQSGSDMQSTSRTRNSKALERVQRARAAQRASRPMTPVDGLRAHTPSDSHDAHHGCASTPTTSEVDGISAPRDVAFRWLADAHALDEEEECVPHPVVQGPVTLWHARPEPTAPPIVQGPVTLWRARPEPTALTMSLGRGRPGDKPAGDLADTVTPSRLRPKPLRPKPLRPNPPPIASPFMARWPLPQPLRSRSRPQSRARSEARSEAYRSSPRPVTPSSGHGQDDALSNQVDSDDESASELQEAAALEQLVRQRVTAMQRGHENERRLPRSSGDIRSSPGRTNAVSPVVSVDPRVAAWRSPACGVPGGLSSCCTAPAASGAASPRPNEHTLNRLTAGMRV